MTTAEKEKKYVLMEKAMNALMADDWDKMLELNKNIVITPQTAMHFVRTMGKERFLALGFNLSEATETFGEGWIDRQPPPREFR